MATVQTMPQAAKRGHSQERQPSSQQRGRKGKQKKAKGDPVAQTFPDCIECCQATTSTNGLLCGICNETYHAYCSGTDVLNVADVSLINNVRRTCVSCRENARSAFNKLQSKNSKLSVLLAQLTQRVAKLEKGHLSSDGAKSQFIPGGAAGGTGENWNR